MKLYIMWSMKLITIMILNLSRLMTKPTKWQVCPVKTQISLGSCPVNQKTQISLGIRPVWSESSLSAWKKLWVLSYQLSAQRRFWSDWADAQAELSLLWVHSHFVGFVMRRHFWTQIRLLKEPTLFAVCIFWSHYSMVKPKNFKF